MSRERGRERGLQGCCAGRDELDERGRGVGVVGGGGGRGGGGRGIGVGEILRDGERVGYGRACVRVVDDGERVDWFAGDVERRRGVDGETVCADEGEGDPVGAVGEGFHV